VFGSSVANGTGDELGQEGYTGRLRSVLAARGWEVMNQSRGGDNTKTMAPRFAPVGEPQPNIRYLLPVNPRYVLLGLSLGNEGVRTGDTRDEKDAIFKQFEAGMRGFVERSRQHHIVPVITLCYTRNDFTEVEYEYTRRMNLLINTWDVPSVNFLGAVDDGTGKWAQGFWYDSLHPNASGHDELTATFVPSLFEALEQGKPRPVKSKATGFARDTGGTALTYAPEARMHPFALAVSVRAQSDGLIVSISGATLNAATRMKKIERGRGEIEIESTSLTPGAAFNATLGVIGGRWTYTSANGRVIESDVKADDGWHQLVVSHYTARGETLFFVDGKLAGTTMERLETTGFAFGAPLGYSRQPQQPIDLKDLFIYRSALNADEVASLHTGTLLQASLDVYAPLADAKFERASGVENRAQSLSVVKATSNLVHVEK
jgi:lysophospholipase L1-like esterase